MSTLIRQEFFKLHKQKSHQIFFIGLIIFQLLVALYSLKYSKFLSPKDAFTNSYFAYIPAIFFFIAICSTNITSERQFGTLRSLLYRHFSYNQILLSKIISLFSYMILTYVINSIFSLILKFIIFNNLQITKSIWKTWLLTSLNQFLTLIFLTSMVLLLGTLIHSSNLAITLGIIGYFVINLFNQLLLYLVTRFNWLKWNPFNMLNLGDQLQDHHLQHLTNLSLTQLATGYTFYVLLFLTLTFYIFRRRKV